MSREGRGSDRPGGVFSGQYPEWTAENAKQLQIEELACARDGIQEPEETELRHDCQHSATVEELAVAPGFNPITR